MAHRRLHLLIAFVLVVPAGAFLALPASASSATATDVTIVSFDGTSLAATLFVPAGADHAHPVPFVLMTHGWAGSRSTSMDGRVGAFLAAGYGVLTWDSRGFGKSGGEVMLDSVGYEVQDVRVLISWLLMHAPVETVHGDPVVGMSGGSYAGGIQLLAAAFDARIDAIAPEITWNDLAQSLGPNGVPKLYWTSLLFGSGAASSCVNALPARDSQNPQDAVDAFRAGFAPAKLETGCQTSDLARYYAEVHATNSIPREVRDALLARSPATYMSRIHVPTLVIQGQPDTLFDVSQAVANYQGVLANGAPAKLWVYDGGHSHPENAAQVPNTQGSLIAAQVVAWFDCHLKTSPDCSRVGAPVEYWTGSAWRNATSWPPAGVDATTHVNGIPPLFEAATPTGSQGSATLALSKAGNFSSTGAVHVAFDVTSHAPEAFLFASVTVLKSDGTTTGPAWGQVQPVRVAGGLLAGKTHVELDLVPLHVDVPAGAKLALQLDTANPNYDTNRVAGFVYVENLDVTYRVDA